MERTNIVNMIPEETTTSGFLKIKEWDQPIMFRFLPREDFRGKLKSIEWNCQDNVKHRITAEDEEFKLFRQIGERPEVKVPSSFFESLDLPETAFIRIRMEFDTFRMEPVWYAYLVLKNAYGDRQKDSDAAYKIPRKGSGLGCEDCCDCEEGCCEDCSYCDSLKISSSSCCGYEPEEECCC